MNNLKTLGAVLTLSTLALAGSKDEDAVRQRVAEFQEAFNKHDAKAISAFFAEDADLVTPTGVRAQGRAEIEKAVATDLATLIHDGKTAFTVTHTRFVKPDVVVLDMTHEVSEAHGPDGTVMPTMKVLVTGVAVKKSGAWSWLAARPMIPFTPPAPPATAKAAPAPAKK